MAITSSPKPFRPPPNHLPFSPEAYAKVGQEISTVASLEEAWRIASRFWIAQDAELPPHFTQAVHIEKRQRWASQLLSKLGNLQTPYDEDDPGSFVDLSALTRLIQAAAVSDDTNNDRVDKEGAWLLDSLSGIHACVGRWDVSMEAETIEALGILLDRVSKLEYPLDQACQALWAMQGLHARIQSLAYPAKIVFEDRVKALPFEIVPLGIQWSKVCPGEDPCETLLRAIPFQKDIIVTRRGEKVQERRGTAWIAQEGIGALAYSGKLMPPQPLPEVVQQVMRDVEKRLDLSLHFDCALCNHYADAEAACKFHTDPEHGTMWDRTTVVVAAGSDRTFAFKPIETTWKEWDRTSEERDNVAYFSEGKAAATVHLFPGDLVVMTSNCNDDFYHAVYAGRNDDPRVSLVLKRAVGNGHGLAGQGRRRRAKRMVAATTLPESSTSPNKNKRQERNHILPQDLEGGKDSMNAPFAGHF